jgi:hypothetical protein
MIVQIKSEIEGVSDLTPGLPYFVIGIEADHYRILNDRGRPYLYDPSWFTIRDSEEPGDWITEVGADGECYAYPKALNTAGFFEDFFDGNPQAISEFWHIVNQRLSTAA